MGISKAKFGKFVRAAAVSGLLGAAGLTITAAPAWAGGESDGASDGADDGEASDGASDGEDDTTTTTTDTADVGADDTSVPVDDSLPLTGSDATVPLMLGGAAVTIVLVGRRLLGTPS